MSTSNRQNGERSYLDDDDDDSPKTANEDSINDDYYAFLNVSKTATVDQIRNAYKALSKRFHPDKHSDPALKLAAESMFNRLKKVYDVLSDEHKRAIYDTVGASGIETDGWALIERKFRSSKEIREEYEQLLRDKEERRLQQRTNPKGSITVLIDATDIFEHYYDDEDEHYLEEGAGDGDDTDVHDFARAGGGHLRWPTIEVRSMTIMQSIESPLTAQDNLIMSGNLSVRNGNGSGTVSAALRHVFSPTKWIEAEFGAGNGPIVSGKYFHTFSENIHGSAQTLLHVTPFGISPGLSFVLTRQFSKNFAGHINWKAGIDSSLSTVALYENEICRINSSLSLGVRHSFASTSYTHKFKRHDARLKIGVKLGTLGAILEYGVDAKASQHSTLGAAISVGTHTGVTLRLKLVRNQQSYIFPIILSEQILPSSIFYGTLVPMLSLYCVKSLFVDPYLRQRADEDLRQEKASNATQIDAERRDATTYRALMRETYDRILRRESNRGGLVIERAVYGDPAVVPEYVDRDLGAQPGFRSIPDSVDAFDVTIAVQCMLEESPSSPSPSSPSSTITFSAASKSFLPGFFDCNYRRTKVLLIRYRFDGESYRVELHEREPAILPNSAHRFNG